MTDIIIALMLLIVVGGAVIYIYKAKKAGKRCIGCPYAMADKCGGKCNCKK